MKKLLFALFLVAIIFPTFALARIGVGVATGKIEVQDKLKPGIIYNLPSLTVLNTGDEVSDYEVSVTYFEKQPQLKPANDWFIFTPKTFNLQPNQTQVVTIKINLPLKVTPGDYFGFLEAHPTRKDVQGQTKVGIAAATKLYFTVVPANFIQAVYYKVVSLWNIYSPWPQRFSLVLFGVLVLVFIRKFFNIQIGLKKTKVNKGREETQIDDIDNKDE